MTDTKTFTWPDGVETAREPGACPFCFKAAVVELTPSLTAVQPDGTTHVCHPVLLGCNHGFRRDPSPCPDPEPA